MRSGSRSGLWLDHKERRRHHSSRQTAWGTCHTSSGEDTGAPAHTRYKVKRTMNRNLPVERKYYVPFTGYRPCLLKWKGVFCSPRMAGISFYSDLLKYYAAYLCIAFMTTYGVLFWRIVLSWEIVEMKLSHHLNPNEDSHTFLAESSSAIVFKSQVPAVPKRLRSTLTALLDLILPQF